MEIQEIINSCRAEDGVIILPNITLDRSDYLKVKKLMESNGAKWKGGKVGGFVCQHADEVLGRLQGGDLSDRKKTFQFFATPVEIGEVMAGQLNDMTAAMRILEPSAGRGALITAIRNVYGNDICPDYCELMPENRRELAENFGDCQDVGDDFLTAKGLTGQYDRIVANPPFAKNQDIRHIRRMYDCLNATGRMVSLCSPHFQFASDKESVEFRQWLSEVGAVVDTLPKGAFHVSGTDIAAVRIVIYKD